MSLAQQAEFQRFAKKSRPERFLEEMDVAMPWAELLALVEPHYPKGEQGRKPMGFSIMLRLYFVQYWFALSDRRPKIPSMIRPSFAVSWA